MQLFNKCLTSVLTYSELVASYQRMRSSDSANPSNPRVANRRRSASNVAARRRRTTQRRASTFQMRRAWKNWATKFVQELLFWLYDGDLLLAGGGSMSVGDPITATTLGGSGDLIKENNVFVFSDLTLVLLLRLIPSLFVSWVVSLLKKNHRHSISDDWLNYCSKLYKICDIISLETWSFEPSWYE